MKKLESRILQSIIMGTEYKIKTDAVKCLPGNNPQKVMHYFLNDFLVAVIDKENRTITINPKINGIKKGKAYKDRVLLLLSQFSPSILLLETETYALSNDVHIRKLDNKAVTVNYHGVFQDV